MPAEPIPFTTTRFRCLFCSRGNAKKSRTREHIARCWSNPAVHGCKTCEHFEPADCCGLPETNQCYTPMCPAEDCKVGVDLSGHGEKGDGDYIAPGPIVGCDKWRAKS